MSFSRFRVTSRWVAAALRAPWGVTFLQTSSELGSYPCLILDRADLELALFLTWTSWLCSITWRNLRAQERPSRGNCCRQSFLGFPTTPKNTVPRYGWYGEPTFGEITLIRPKPIKHLRWLSVTLRPTTLTSSEDSDPGTLGGHVGS